MSANTVKPPPCAIVVFGANGDLTKRLIVPALYNLSKTGLLPERFALIGVDHSTKGLEAWRAGLREFLEQTLAKSSDCPTIDEKHWQPIANAMSYVSGDFTDSATYAKLAAHLAEPDAKEKLGGNILFHLAVAARFFAKVVDELGKVGLEDEKNGWRRVIVEKPFGHDVQSARDLNSCLRKWLKEEQIF